MRLFAITTGLGAVLLLVGPWPVPAGPPRFESADEVRRAGQESLAEAHERAPLRAGFGRSEIRAPTGANGAALAGYGARAFFTPKPAEDVHDPCAARAIALSQGGPPALVLGADLLYASLVVRARVLDGLARDPGIPGDRVMFTATHSHSAPGNWPSARAEAIVTGPFREDVTGAIVSAFLAAARAAVRDLAAAEVRVGRATEPRFVENRYWHRGERLVPVDADLTVFWFRAPADHAVRGLLAVFGAHATVVGPGGPPSISADWPGAFEGALERDHRGAVALLAAGSVGSQAPRARGEGSDFDRASRMGEALAKDAGSFLDAAPRPPQAIGAPEWTAFEGMPGMALRTIAVRFPPLVFRFAPGWRASPALQSLLYPLPAEAPISVLRLGGDAVLGFPAEISGEVSLGMKEAARARGVRLTVTSFAGGYHGYVPPDAYYERWRYENTLSLHGPRFAEFLGAVSAAAVP